jgi:tRNA dimethylallyltransferase
MDSARRSCPVIVGPTAVGKTELITHLAAEHSIEVISLDSRQIYHGLRIGTAQPTAEELAICPHHLVDFVSPEEKYDAVRFRSDFERVFTDVTSRGGVPILVGGAGLYLTAVREGFLEIPGNDTDKLAAVRRELEPLDNGAIRARLTSIDPASAGRLHANDRYRLQRALEIFLISGRTMTELTAEQKPNPSFNCRFPTFVLERPVSELDDRIARRTEEMLAGGWVEETTAALQTYPADCPGLQSIGYREIVAMLAGQMSREELQKSIVRVTRQYAKRQRTWFRKVKASGSGAPSDRSLMARIAAQLRTG